MDSTGRRRAREEVLRRAFDLPWRDQYTVWEIIGSYLQPGGAAETTVSKELRERAEALDCLERAAKHLDLWPDRAPTNDQYAKVQKELGLPLSWQTVGRRWERWRAACNALVGERIAESPQQRAQRRASSGRRRGNEDYLEGVRMWLGQNPPSRTRSDYDTWLPFANEARVAAGERPFVAGHAIVRGLTLPWLTVLRVAERDIELSEAQREWLEELTRESGRLKLIGTAGIALIHGVGGSYADELTRRPGFPAPVAKIGPIRAWYRRDIETHQAGRKPPRRTAGELQDRLLDSPAVCRSLGMKPDTLIAGIHRRAAWAPQPTGAVSGYHYWLREDFERWLATRPNRDAKEAIAGVKGAKD